MRIFLTRPWSLITLPVSAWPGRFPRTTYRRSGIGSLPKGQGQGIGFLCLGEKETTSPRPRTLDQARPRSLRVKATHVGLRLPFSGAKRNVRGEHLPAAGPPGFLFDRGQGVDSPPHRGRDFLPVRRRGGARRKGKPGSRRIIAGGASLTDRRRENGDPALSLQTGSRAESAARWRAARLFAENQQPAG